MAFAFSSPSPEDPDAPQEMAFTSSPATPSPAETAGPPAGAPDLQALLRNPLVLAGGAVLAGIVLSRVLATSAARQIARELAAEALQHLKPAATMVGTAAVGSLVEMGVERYRGQITAFGKKMLADLLVNKE